MVVQKRTQAWCCVFILSVQLFFPLRTFAAVTDNKNQPKVTADSAILMDVATGEVLFEKNGHQKRPPASTTKIMTAILGLELGRPDEVVTVSSKAASVGEATLHLDPGEKIVLYELITGALLRSGNDACVAIAEHIAGTEEKFVDLMNKKAKLLGAENTNFVNTNGLHHKNHYSTAYDLALMARYALQNPSFASIARLRETSIHFLEPDVFMDIRNTNKLLWNYPYADGVKTGTTAAAGKCLVASATKDGRQLVTVVLHAADRFGDAKRLLEWGFEQTELVKMAQAGQVVSEFVLANKQSVNAFVSDPVEFNVDKDDIGKISVKINWVRGKELPIKAGEFLGNYEIYIGDKLIKSVSLLSDQEIGKTKRGLSALYKNLNQD